MDDELERLINTLIEGVECYLCGSSIKIRADGLQNQSDELYVADYHCPGCDVGYDIEVRDRRTQSPLRHSERTSTRKAIGPKSLAAPERRAYKDSRTQRAIW